MAELSHACLGPNNTKWDADLFMIISLIKHINDQLWIKFGHSKFEDRKEGIRRNLDFIKTPEIIIDIERPILTEHIRYRLFEEYKNAGWSDVDFMIWEGHQDDKSI